LGATKGKQEGRESLRKAQGPSQGGIGRRNFPKGSSLRGKKKKVKERDEDYPSQGKAGVNWNGKY